MKQYLDLLKYVMERGEDRKDRTGVGTRGVFGYQMRMNLADGFPILTTKKVFWKGVVVELLWFLRGDTNIRWLQENGVHIWDEWADADGELGPVYGKQWRRWDDHFASTKGHIDQVGDLVKRLTTDPFSRRHVVTAWNPEDVPKMKLPPCHTLWQCHVSADGKRLNLHLYCRSIDSFLGLPFNIASYALLLSILARITGLVPGELILSFGDLHIYQNHMEQVAEQLAREPKPLPRLEMTGPEGAAKFGVDGFVPEDFKLAGYEPMAAIKAPVAV